MRVYPHAWRARYGPELAQLLMDDMAERPLSPVRTADVVGHGLWTRLAFAGLVGDAVAPERRSRAALGALAGLVAAFLVVGVALWSQLTIGWQWSAPAAPGTKAGMIVMSGALLGFGLIAALAAGPIAWALLGALRRNADAIWRPLVLSFAGAVLLLLGSRHFGAGWPGTGGHAWAGRNLVPGSVARLGWAATLWITSYWAHPGALRSFPAGEIAWMAVSPFALLAVMGGGLRTLRRLELSERTQRWETCLALVAAGVMAAFVAGAGSWVLSGGPGPKNLFRVGAIDMLALALLTVALVAASHSLRRAVGGSSRRRAA
ncbi:MAG TPA: hypothetical protein VIJ20_10975 [Solirubrobacteraceae bacterium]